MFRRLLALTLVLAPATAQAEWYRVETKRFSMMGDFKSEAEARARGEKLEKFVFVLNALSAQPNVPSPQKVSVYFVPTLRDMHATLPGDADSNYYSGVAAYYLPNARQSYVITPIRSYSSGQMMNTNRAVVTGKDNFAEDAFWHELSHAFMFQSVSYAYPPWYSEGYAEYYGTITIDDKNKVTVGSPQHGRIDILRSNWYPSRKFLADRNYAQAGENLRSIYAEGWLLIHYAANNKERGAQMKKYLADINANVPYSEAAKAFGDLDQLDRELQQYVSKSIPMISLSFKAIDTGPIEVRKATPAEVALYKPDLKLNIGVFKRDFPSFVSEVRAQAALFPSDPYALGVLTEAEAKAGNLDQAQAANVRWLAVAPNDPLAIMYRGRLATMKLAKDKVAAADPRWTAARADLLAANKAAPSNPFVKSNLYDSFTDARVFPPEYAQVALFQALKAVPHDDDLRFQVAQDYEKRGLTADAITIIKPSAVTIRPDSELKPGELERKKRRDAQRKKEYAMQGEDVERETAREFYDRLVGKQGGAESKAIIIDKAAAKDDDK